MAAAFGARLSCRCRPEETRSQPGFRANGWKPGRRERNFWKQRPEAKNPPERPLLSAETGKLKISMKNPPRNRLFSIGDRFFRSGRLGGGGRSQIPTRLPVIFPISRVFSKKNT